MSNVDFYKDLSSFRDFVHDACDDHYYESVPDDWLVTVADVVSSTKAVDSGKYAEVNYLGAACIVAAGNAVPEIVFPSVFGGDGATLVIPPEAADRVFTALLATKRWGKSSFGLELRVGAVSLKDLRRHGASLRVAKLEFSPKNDMAMFRGSALELADKLVKDGENGRSFEIEDSGAGDQPDLNTLSCRWEPLFSENGNMLCILANARTHSIDEADVVYAEILEQIDAIVDLDEVTVCPVKLSNTRFKFPSWGIIREAKSRGGIYWLNLIKVTAFHLFVYTIDRFQIKVGGFDPVVYRRELTINADFRKMRGLLSLVVDCSEAQAEQIEALLKSMHANGTILYGVHRSSHAIMTCVVPSASEHEHVHFIDGGDGGFWRAADGLKDQMKAIA